VWSGAASASLALPMRAARVRTFFEWEPDASTISGFLNWNPVLVGAVENFIIYSVIIVILSICSWGGIRLFIRYARPWPQNLSLSLVSFLIGSVSIIPITYCIFLYETVYQIYFFNKNIDIILDVSVRFIVISILIFSPLFINVFILLFYFFRFKSLNKYYSTSIFALGISVDVIEYMLLEWLGSQS
jgi:hypothetical protein